MRALGQNIVLFDYRATAFSLKYPHFGYRATVVMQGPPPRPYVVTAGGWARLQAPFIWLVEYIYTGWTAACSLGLSPRRPRGGPLGAHSGGPGRAHNSFPPALPTNGGKPWSTLLAYGESPRGSTQQFIYAVYTVRGGANPVWRRKSRQHGK